MFEVETNKAAISLYELFVQDAILIKRANSFSLGGGDSKDQHITIQLADS